MTDIVTASVKGIVRNPTAATITPSTEAQLPLAAHGQVQTSDIHGKWFEVNYRGKLFSANVTAVTIPVVASGLVSVFTLYNPPGSGVIGEIVATQLGQVLATTVVDTVGWYSSSAILTGAGTFTTLASPRSSNIQGSAANAIKFYSAYTHSGTPIREEIIAAFGATTDAGLAFIEKQHEGRLILPEGIAMSVAMSTAAGTTSGLDIQATWAEWTK
jgi:hypothetical protein